MKKSEPDLCLTHLKMIKKSTYRYYILTMGKIQISPIDLHRRGSREMLPNDTRIIWKNRTTAWKKLPLSFEFSAACSPFSLRPIVGETQGFRQRDSK